MPLNRCMPTIICTIQTARDIQIVSATIHNPFDSKDDLFSAGCRDASQCQHNISFQELHSPFPGRSTGTGTSNIMAMGSRFHCVLYTCVPTDFARENLILSRLSHPGSPRVRTIALNGLLGSDHLLYSQLYFGSDVAFWTEVISVPARPNGF